MDKVGFIGAGSMAEALVAGLLNGGVFKPEQIIVANRSNSERLQELSKSIVLKQHIIKRSWPRNQQLSF